MSPRETPQPVLPQNQKFLKDAQTSSYASSGGGGNVMTEVIGIEEPIGGYIKPNSSGAVTP